LKTSIAAFLILLPLLFGLTFDNKHILTKELGKDVLQRRLTFKDPGMSTNQSYSKFGTYKG